jgi:hypothetical protein
VGVVAGSSQGIGDQPRDDGRVLTAVHLLPNVQLTRRTAPLFPSIIAPSAMRCEPTTRKPAPWPAVRLAAGRSACRSERLLAS